MTRKLPWKHVEQGPASTLKPAKSTAVSQKKVKRDEYDVDSNEQPTSSVAAKRAKGSVSRSASATPNRITRPASTSPPPEPLPESYMIEGLEHDDLFRMVEDEFLSTAQQFTAHLHAAEYHRLKAASKTQNADTIKNISRPVVGRMTDLVKKKQDRKMRIERQRSATRKASANKRRAGEETDPEDDSWHSKSLYGLMESPRKQAARLNNLTKVVTTTTTRAAAGFSEAKSRLLFAAPRPTPSPLSSAKSMAKPTLTDVDETEEDDEDDLDAPSRKTYVKLDRQPPLSAYQSPKPRQAKHVPSENQQLRHGAHLAKQVTEPEAAKEVDSSDDSGGDFLGRLKRRQEDRKRTREQRKLEASKSRAARAPEDIIPGFL
ncbi:hypothetical protein GGR54DRAFT_131264 [Hypoxylon sp. NC1633]|nr:hypothetical protein GGR54DRAFT_131264 [Hypoxylon sp. NC1633]